MSLVTLEEILADAGKRKYAVGSFNTVNLEMLRAVIRAAEEERSPVIIAQAEVHLPYGELEVLAPAMVRAAKEASVPVAVHFDHGMTYENIAKALHLGFTSVMFDGSTLPYEENIAKTSEITKLARVIGASVEAELGHVGGAEGGEEGMHEDCYTNIEQAYDFSARTGIQALAVAIGTAHGQYRTKPVLDLERLSLISSKVDVPLVLHGGSGLTDEDFKMCIQNGIRKINIFTDLALAAANRLKAEIGNPISYLDLMSSATDAIKEEAAKKMRLFGSSGRI